MHAATTSATRRALASPCARAALVLVAVLVLDQIAKRLVSRSIVPGERIAVVPGVHLVHTRNHGVAFGLEAGHGTLVAILVGLALLGLLVYFATHSSRPLIWLATGLLLGGALGNLLDRIRTGSVLDFIQLPLGWPPFNLADASIVLGVALLLFAIESPRSASHERVHPGG
ncbi:MAG TPA: signal peptidase II [Solirubrobacteraceae bacterium]